MLDQQFPDLKPHLRDEAGQIRRFLNVYVNEEDIRFLGGDELRLLRRRRDSAGALDRRRGWLDPVPGMDCRSQAPRRVNIFRP